MAHDSKGLGAVRPSVLGRCTALSVLTAAALVHAQPPHPAMCPTHHSGPSCVPPDPCCTPFVESGCAHASKDAPWCSHTLSHKARAAAAVAAMNLTEK